MTTILTELLEQTSKSALDEQLKIVCDQIMIEEKPKFINTFDIPTGPNIFLAIQYQDGSNISFLCLEREEKEKYIVSVWSKKRTEPIKRKKVWDVHEHKSEKILKYYAEKLKYVKGN
jgi:hypothetical protein